MGRGRPKKDTVQVTFRLNFDYMEKLKLINPQLLTRDSEGNSKFRHGALGRYIQRLIREDLEKRQKNLDQLETQGHIDLNALMEKKE
jgi:hypothetical protein